MASDSGSSFIKRNRPPRVQIQYQDPHVSDKMVELPFVMGVMSDLSGNHPGVEKAPVEDRSFSDVTKDTLDDFMQSIEPGVTFTTEDRLTPGSGQKLGVNLRFNKMGDFDPAAIARQVPSLRKLLEAREQLANLQRYIAAKPKAQQDVQRMLSDPALLSVMASRLPNDSDDAE